jgi:hypothetical protein
MAFGEKGPGSRTAGPEGPNAHWARLRWDDESYETVSCVPAVTSSPTVPLLSSIA